MLGVGTVSDQSLLTIERRLKLTLHPYRLTYRCSCRHRAGMQPPAQALPLHRHRDLALLCTEYRMRSLGEAGDGPILPLLRSVCNMATDTISWSTSEMYLLSEQFRISFSCFRRTRRCLQSGLCRIDVHTKSRYFHTASSASEPYCLPIIAVSRDRWNSRAKLNID